MEKRKFSIVVPTYNEEKDITRTLDYLVSIEYKNKEIIIVDDSTDSTPKIVREYEDRNVKLIIPEERKGRSEARNIGIRNSSGEVIVILNADVLIPKDFLARINKYYDEGYDVVSVMNFIENTEDLFARYVGMHAYKKEKKGIFEKRKKELNDLWWTEGFSARKECIMKTSLFPSGYSVPIEAGEDVRFVDELRSLGCKGIFVRAIEITHIAPSTFSEYWSIRKGRGAGTPQVRYFLDNWSIKKIKKRAFLKAIKRLAYVISIYPMLKHNYELAKFSNKNTFVDTILFSYAWLIEQIAMTVGEFRSLNKIMKKEKL